MKRSCIVFACTIISEERLVVLHKFLQSFKDTFSDSDIFVGINPVSVPDVEDIINSYGLNIKLISRCPEHLYTNSDASAYQIALKNLKDSGYNYDHYWFVHTKSGVNTHSDYLKDWYINNFLGRRNAIETFIDAMPGIGSYGMLGLEYDESRILDDTDCEIDLFKNTISNSLPYTHSHFFYIHTLYVISKEPMNVFLKLVTNKWFETKLDRYYFEGVFPFIVSRSGFFQYTENRFSCTNTDLQPYIQKWIDTNELHHYNKYIDTFKTNFLFHQLQPPYVNSNT
jgi:hypothetical protein